MPKQERVVVIGGGYAGYEAARSLDKHFDVTLVAGVDTFRHIVFGLRACVLPEQTPKMHIPYDNLLQRGTVKKCKATKINVEEAIVNLASGDSLPYDYLVLATGILHPKTVGVGNNVETAAEHTAVFQQANADLKAAQNILIIGGGPVGIEMAGEIIEEVPGKSVTLVTSKGLILSPGVEFPERFRTRLKTKLEQVGVTVHTDVGRVYFDREDVNACGFIPGKKTYSWTGGELEADLCIVCTGATQIPSLYVDSGLQSWLNEMGQIMVEDTFEVKGSGPGSTKRVFAVGDCTDLAVPKTAYLANIEGASVAKQIVAASADAAAAAAGGKPKPLKSAKPMVLPISLVPVGKSGGVSSLPMGIVVGDFLTRRVKSKDMFVSKYWAELNAGKPPVI
ncbi:unnamed protein product [Pylaiella littoralis]